MNQSFSDLIKLYMGDNPIMEPIHKNILPNIMGDVRQSGRVYIPNNMDSFMESPNQRPIVQNIVKRNAIRDI